MVTVAEYSNVDQALLLKSMLEGNGITAFAPHVLYAGTGVRVQVAEEDVENALVLINSE